MWCADCEHCQARRRHEAGVYHEHRCELSGAQVFPATGEHRAPDEMRNSLIARRSGADRRSDMPRLCCPARLIDNGSLQGTQEELAGVIRVARARGTLDALLAHYSAQDQATLLMFADKHSVQSRQDSPGRPEMRGRGQAGAARVVMNEQAIWA
jgi:hypothetical protein